MLSLRTRFFGELEYNEDAIIHIPSGLPPFVTATQYLLLEDERRKPLVFLQSAEIPELCFITIPVETASPGYSLKLEPEHLAAIQCSSTEPPQSSDLTCLVILTIPERGPVTANLMAPIVVNARNNVGVQAIRTDARYSHTEPLAQEQAQC